MADRKLTKSIGEHWVCSVLAGEGWAVALTRDGLARTDVLAAHTESGAVIEVQVKTASHTGGRSFSWLVGAKACLPARTDHEWYVLVGLGRDAWNAHCAWVVPRDHMAAATWIRHQEWLTNPNAPVGTRNALIGMARIQDYILARYQDRWDLIGTKTDEVPVMLPPRFREWALGDRVGLPDAHPWRTALPDWDPCEPGTFDPYFE